jgi:putative ABC transport system substrate-binding protein
MMKNNSQKKSQKAWALVTLLMVITMILSGCGTTEAKTYRVGLLSGADSFDSVFDGFKAQMAELGYVEGKNISYDYQASGGDEGKMAQFAQQFVDEFLKQMAPGVETLWIIYDPDYATAPSSVPAVQAGATSMGVRLVESHAKSPEDVNAELQKRAAMDKLDVDAIQLMPDPLNSNSAEAIIDFANQHNIPVVGHALGQVKSGALFSYADSYPDTGKKAASLADQILKGAKPGDLPVEISDLFLNINLKAANSLGITVPEGILGSAKEIIR